MFYTLPLTCVITHCGHRPIRIQNQRVHVPQNVLENFTWRLCVKNHQIPVFLLSYPSVHWFAMKRFRRDSFTVYFTFESKYESKFASFIIRFVQFDLDLFPRFPFIFPSSKTLRNSSFSIGVRQITYLLYSLARFFSLLLNIFVCLPFR